VTFPVVEAHSSKETITLPSSCMGNGILPLDQHCKISRSHVKFLLVRLSVSPEHGPISSLSFEPDSAGGIVLGNGTWITAGGNQAVDKGGVSSTSQPGGGDYKTYDGGKALR
jgi:hypothetical protein